MSRDKHIEEMAQCLCEWNRGTLCILDDKDCDLQCTYGKLANKLTAKGYRKSTDVAEEIFAENHNMLLKILKATDDGLGEAIRKDDEKAKDVYTGAKETIRCAMLCLAELKKKYTKGGNEQDG